MWFLWSIWMEFFMEIIEQIFQEMIWIEYGDIREEIITVKFIPSRNFFITSTKLILFLSSLTFMVIATLLTHSSMEILLQKKTQKILVCFLITAVEKSSKYHLVSQLSVFRKTKKPVQEWFCLKCFPKPWFTPLKTLFMVGRKEKMSLNILLTHIADLEKS